MTNGEEMAEQTAGDEPAASAGGLDVQLAQELIERAKAEGVSLVGPGGLLAGVTKTVLQATLDAEMSEHLGYAKGVAVRSSRAGTGRRDLPARTSSARWRRRHGCGSRSPASAAPTVAATPRQAAGR
jgi:hypothetical protein